MIHLTLDKNVETRKVDWLQIDNYYRGFEAPTPGFTADTIALTGYEVARVRGVGSLTMVTGGMPCGEVVYNRGWVTVRYRSVYDLIRGLLRDKLLLKLAIANLREGEDSARSLMMVRYRVSEQEAETSVSALTDQISTCFEGSVKDRMFDLVENVKIRDSLDRENRERWTMVLQALIHSIVESGDDIEVYSKLHEKLYETVLSYIRAMATRVRNVLAQVNDFVNAPWSNLDHEGMFGEDRWALMKKARETLVLPLIADLYGVCAEPFYGSFQRARQFLVRMSDYILKIYNDRPEDGKVNECLSNLRSLASCAARELYTADMRERLEPANGLASSILEEIQLGGNTAVGLAHYAKRVREASLKHSQQRNALSPYIDTERCDRNFRRVMRAMDAFGHTQHVGSREEMRTALSELERTYHTLY